MAMIHDKSCRACGYELNGLGPQGSCPECGAAYDIETVEGVSGGVMDKHLRGQWMVKLCQALGLAFTAVVLLAAGVLLSWLKGNHAALIFLGSVSVIFLVSAAVAGWSLRRR
jgi:hypothetical protein